MRKKFDARVKSYEITDRQKYIGRRAFMQSAGKTAAVAALALSAPAFARRAWAQDRAVELGSLASSSFSTAERQNSFMEATSYNITFGYLLILCI